MSSRVVELNVPWRFLAFYLLLQIWANHNHSWTAGLDSLQLLDLSAWCTSQESRRKPVLPCMSGGWIQLPRGFWNKDSHQWRLFGRFCYRFFGWCVLCCFHWFFLPFVYSCITARWLGKSICPIPKPRKKVGSTEFRETRSFYCNISLATGVLTSNTRGMWVATFAQYLVHMTIKQKDFEGAMLCTYSEVLEARCQDSSCSIEVVVPEDESDQSFLFLLQKKEQPSFNVRCLGWGYASSSWANVPVGSVPSAKQSCDVMGLGC